MKILRNLAEKEVLCPQNRRDTHGLPHQLLVYTSHTFVNQRCSTGHG